jgi:hypothetical protein
MKFLSGRTRVFFTNQLQFCTDVKRIYVLEDGALTESGTYQELCEKKPPGPFAVLLESVCGQNEGLYEISEKPQEKEAETDFKPTPPEEDLEGPEGEMMQREYKSGGRIGIEDFMVISRAADSTFLGVAWIGSSLILMPVL